MAILNYNCRMKYASCRANYDGLCCRNCSKPACSYRCDNYPATCGKSRKVDPEDAIPAPADPRFGKEWSDKEEEFLIEANEILTRQEIADQLGRALASVNSHASHIGLTGRNRILPPDPSKYLLADFRSGMYDRLMCVFNFKFICPRCRRTILAGYIRSRDPYKTADAIRYAATELCKSSGKPVRHMCKCGQTVKLWEVKN